MRNAPNGGPMGRLVQAWAGFLQGWRFVAAHVSTMLEP
jgi:hypothetical protein